MDFIEEKKIVSFQSGAIKEILDPKEYLFSLSPKTANEGRELAKTIDKYKSADNVAVLYLETQWGIEYRDSFKEEWIKDQNKISLLSSSKIGETDFKTQALLIRKNNPGAVVLIHLGGMLGTAIKQIRDMGYKGIIYSTTDSNDKNMFVSARGSEKGLRYLSTDGSAKTNIEQAFERMYQENFKDQSTSLSKNAYDSAFLLTTALHECKLDSACAKDKLYKIENHQGASGVFTIETDGGVSRELNERELE
jgi:ABC-type branched-subunit amino acid transport system substrate-binding protein